MGAKPRQKPKHLAAKLLQIRQRLQLSQVQIANRLKVYHGRVSEFETGAREPSLLVLLAYSQLAGVYLEYIINDKISLTRFRDALVKEIALIEKAK